MQMQMQMHALRLDSDAMKSNTRKSQRAHTHFRGANCEAGGLVPQAPESQLRTLARILGYSDTNTLCFAGYLAGYYGYLVYIVESDSRPLAGIQARSTTGEMINPVDLDARRRKF
jgi:hypothetical protein